MFSPFWNNLKGRAWMWTFPRQAVEIGALLAKQNRVQLLQCHLDESAQVLVIVAKVVESTLTPYEAKLELKLNPYPELKGTCLCAATQGCRHVAAMLYACCSETVQAEAEALNHELATQERAGTSGSSKPVIYHQNLRSKPILKLERMQIGSGGKKNRILQIARPLVQYDGLDFAISMVNTLPTLQWADGDQAHCLERNLELEREWLKQLRLIGLAPLPEVDLDLQLDQGHEVFGVEEFEELGFWDKFVSEDLHYFSQKGWIIEKAEDFGFETLVVRNEDWLTKIDNTESSTERFGFQVQILVDDETVDLIPLLVEALQSRLSYQDVLKHPRREYHFLIPGSHRRVLRIPGARLSQLLGILYELNYKPKKAVKGSSLITHLQIDRLRAVQLMSLEGSAFEVPDRLRELKERLADFNHLPEISLPDTLRAQLRPYQHAGVQWLQFLRIYQLHGVLADDMGLGKTLQSIAHLLIEKKKNSEFGPSLIVAPTSVLKNWFSEIKKFAPELRVLMLQGDQRKSRYVSIPFSDIVLTSYPLILKDAEKLSQISWHYLLLDEAHYIKNAKTKVALTLRTLQAKHRLCLTGTPMENHLGELWSLFAFLMPGYLGDADMFRAQYRVPIEKYQRKEALDRLNLKLKPLMLRRTKDQVAKELPPKTELVHLIQFEPAQRDLYETLRALMSQRVQEAIAEQGLERSKMLVLEALLKLRQVCCHPDLLKLPEKREPLCSAKTDFLIDDLLPRLIEQGRRILLFSQFTTLLQLLATRLQAEAIPFVTLTGQHSAEERERSIQTFKHGKVPVFLISLKAGGVGLNLTEADTIIHYDPWWNPAVEQQATDRAHRIGQKNPVFVHKLICQDSVEERIVELQRNKQAALQQLLDGSVSLEKLSLKDLEELLRPF